MKAFETTGDASTVSIRWKAWLEEFEAYADSKGLFITVDSEENKAQRRALLLYIAGPAVRETFKTLAEIGNAIDYDAAITALNTHYTVQPNATYQRHLFRKAIQNADETVAQYVTRLKKASLGCDYTDGDNQIRDQVVEHCRSDRLRRKLLEKGEALTLKETLKTAAMFETVESQFQSMKLDEQDVRRVSSRPPPQQYTRSDGKESKNQCYRCGHPGHYGRDPTCPARGKICKNCDGRDHFAKVCRSKSQTTKRGEKKTGEKKTGWNPRPKKKVHHLETQGEDSDSDKSCYAFKVNSTSKLDKIPVKVGGVNIDVVVDSGSDSNIIDRELWEKLKSKKIQCKSRKCTRRLYPYTSKTPLQTVGCFEAEIEAGDQKLQADFIVIEEKGQPLLGRETAVNLGLLKIGIGVNAISSTEKIVDDYQSVFTGIGKLQGRQVKLSVDPQVKPVAQPVRRTPFGLRDKVESKIQELIDKNIIEPVEEPTEWVSPVVVVPKANGEIRMCIDMRRANEAVLRERHPIPTIDELLQEMSQSRVFSKIDLKWGYHQLELHPDSRNITTFVTHCGLYRYKRLLFGINAASEIYQHEIQKVIQGIPGAANISDDIVIHTKDHESHEKALRHVLERLGTAGLTVNKDKCEFFKSELTFTGHKVSDKGVDPTKEKVEAVLKAREPETVSEVRSFLGLVNYSARYIPDLATLAEPLRQLTRKNQPFIFGEDQRKAFNALKNGLASARTLGYYDPKAKTKVIADASPVGLGAVLIQEQKGEHRVINYASRSLTDVERRYSQTEKEALALVWACEKFHLYLYGINFDLLTDHKPLEAIYSPRSKPCARVERWVLRLQPYQFRVVHVPGTKNIADPLSRLLKTDVLSKSKLGDQAEEYVRFVAISATPKAMTTREVERASADDDELQEVRECIDTGKWDSCTQKLYAAINGELCTIGKLVLRGSRIVIPRKLRPRVLSLAHEGHLGIVGTKQNLRSRVWWPGLEKDAEKYCKTCYGCQLVSRPNPPEPIRSTNLPEGPWQDLAVDFLGPLPSGESVLVVVDYYSRYYELDIMRSTTAEKTVDSLKRIFARHGLPLSISSDNGPQFRSEVFANYMTDNGIAHHKVTPKWPQANGEVERQNQSLEKRMKIAQVEGTGWKSAMVSYMAAYRATPHATTGKSPAELLFGRKIRTKLPELTGEFIDQEVRDHDAERKGMAKMYADKKRGAVESDISPGDMVLLKREQTGKLDTPFYPEPYHVVSKAGSKVTVESPIGVRYDRNSSHVKKFLAQQDNSEEGNIPDQPQETISQSQAEEKISTLPPPPPLSSTPRPSRVRTMPNKFRDFVMK